MVGIFFYNFINFFRSQISGSDSGTLVFDDNNQGLLYIGGDPFNPNYFTGSIREIYVAAQNFEQGEKIVSVRKRLDMTKNIISSLMFYSMLAEGYGNSIQYRQSSSILEISNTKIKWIDDYSFMNLCPSHMVPTILLNSSSQCCTEQILYLNGHDKLQKSINLPAPQNYWTSKGTVCFNIYIGQNSAFFKKSLFYLNPFEVFVEYTGIELKFSVQTNGPPYFTEFAYVAFTWSHVCVSFDTVTSTGNTIYKLFESTTGVNQQISYTVVLDFTPVGNIQILKDAAEYKIYVKNMILLNDVINLHEFNFLYTNGDEYFFLPILTCKVI